MVFKNIVEEIWKTRLNRSVPVNNPDDEEE
jgi:hypothetical protein